MSTAIERHNKCQFCGKTFHRKKWFHRHSCKKKKQFEETNDIVIQQAFRVYSYWAKRTKIIPEHRAPKMETFLKGPLKKPFVAMMMYTREHGIMSPYTYIDWILAKRITQKDWINENLLDDFKEYVDAHEDPEDHALCTLREIAKWMLDDNSRTAQDYLDHLTPGTILALLRKNRIKPWVLFTYEPIIDKWLGDDTYDPDVYFRIDELINCDHWIEKQDTDETAADIVKEVMDQLWEQSPT